MDKSIEKLMYILKKEYNELATKTFENSLKESYTIQNDEAALLAVKVGTIATWLSYTDEETIHNVIFDNFEFLSSILTTKKLTDKDVFNIINYILKRNIASSILDDTVEIKPSSFSIENFNRSINVETIKEYGKDATYFESYIRMQKQRMQFQTYEENSKEGLDDKNLTNYKNLQSEHAKINDLYLSVNTYNEKDINQVFNALVNLGLSKKVAERYCTYMKFELYKLKEKNTSSVKKVENQLTQNPPIIEQSKPINRRLIKKTYKELETYFDFFNMEAIRTLTYDEIIFCLAKLKKTDVTETTMNEFITKIDRFNYQNDFIVYASNILKRLQQYKNTLQDSPDQKYQTIIKTINELEECLNGYHKTDDETEKEIWTEYITEEVPNALILLQKNK